MAILRKEDGTVVSGRCVVADSAWLRTKGLLGRASLDEDEGILLRPGSSIHMFFMRFAIDAVFLDKELRVLRVAAQSQAVADGVEAGCESGSRAAGGTVRTGKRRRGRPARARGIAAAEGYGARSVFVSDALAPPLLFRLTTKRSRAPFFTVAGRIHVVRSSLCASMIKLSVVSL